MAHRVESLTPIQRRSDHVGGNFTITSALVEPSPTAAGQADAIAGRHRMTFGESIRRKITALGERIDRLTHKPQTGVRSHRRPILKLA